MGGGIAHYADHHELLMILTISWTKVREARIPY